jgi:hypothetical protein
VVGFWRADEWLAFGTRRRQRWNCSFKADKLVGGSDAVLVIDDTAVPKKGKHSVGVRNFGAWQERQLARWRSRLADPSAFGSDDGGHAHADRAKNDEGAPVHDTNRYSHKSDTIPRVDLRFG